MQANRNKFIDPDLLKLAERIKLFRCSAGWSQAHLANNMGRDKQTIQRLEKGKVNPGFLLLRDIARGLNVRLGILMDIGN